MQALCNNYRIDLRCRPITYCPIGCLHYWRLAHAILHRLIRTFLTSPRMQANKGIKV
jgi:hypothetical protein